MTSIADLTQDLPTQTFEPGAILLAEGGSSGRLYVLVDGAVEILKGDFQINLVSDRGALFGDMSALLAIPHMATVRTVTRSTVRVIEGGEDFLRTHQEISFHLAKMLAERLHGVTAYLVDLKAQFEDNQDHLGMVDEILESLVHQQPQAFTPGSDRDPEM